jgi:hypothetical protein
LNEIDEGIQVDHFRGAFRLLTVYHWETVGTRGRSRSDHDGLFAINTALLTCLLLKRLEFLELFFGDLSRTTVLFKRSCQQFDVLGSLLALRVIFAEPLLVDFGRNFGAFECLLEVAVEEVSLGQLAHRSACHDMLCTEQLDAELVHDLEHSHSGSVAVLRLQDESDVNLREADYVQSHGKRTLGKCSTHKDGRELGMVGSVNDIPQSENMLQESKRDISVPLQVFQHGKIVIVANGFRMMNAQCTFGNNDGLTLKLDGSVDVQVEILVFVAFSLQLLNAQSNKLVHGHGVLIVGRGNFGVDNLMNLFVHVDTF